MSRINFCFLYINRSISQMSARFVADYCLHLESGRLYELLKKHVSNWILIREQSTRVTNDEIISSQKIFLFRKKK
ncbi:hypothetical protein, partial [Sphingobacterium sp. LRF_L2]|uniref:hypothetical protein n=1 Tax=Sphingobacterium sp. LRF_L2 TaxID=3369421 RepID=UPI003F636977